MGSISGGWRGPGIVGDGLVLYLDAGSPSSYLTEFGTTWKDVSGNNLNGTLVGAGVTYSNTNGGIFNFDGTSYVNINTGYPSTNNLTYQMWVKPTVLSGLISLISFVGWNTGYVHFVFSGNTLDFAMNGTANASSSTDQVFGYIFSTNTWYNIAVTYNAPSRIISLYINGVLYSSLTYVTAIASSQQPINIGGWNSSRYFTGSMGPISIYNSSLTASEIIQNYNASKARFGLS